MVAALGLAAAIWLAFSGKSRPAGPTPVATAREAASTPRGAPARSTPAPVVAQADASAPASAVLLATTWGSGEGQLGRHRQPEGNAEGPMSFVRTADELIVLDQVNERVTRFDANGKPRGSFKATSTTQDITVAKDGTVVLLDRLVDKNVRLVDRYGRTVGNLALPEDRVGDTGKISGVFVDGSDVYVEKGHGVLARIGSTDGSPVDPAELNGRPSRDGALLLMAALSVPNARVNVNAFDRRLKTLRFARAVQFPKPARQIMLLDSDLAGTIYLGVMAGDAPMVHIACLDGTDGHALGRISVPTSDTPDESFRDFSVADDGTIVLALRTEEGVEYRTTRCP